jgi:hypothetical protein
VQSHLFFSVALSLGALACTSAGEDPSPANSEGPKNCDALTLGGACDGDDLDLCRDGILVCNAAGTGLECQEQGTNKLETCNGQDDDCDGVSDEDFLTNGLYLSVADCGACNATCTIANAGTMCVTFGDAEFACLAETCDTGYKMGLDNDCVPAGADGCEVCTTSQDCKAGLSCITLGTEKYCVEPCQETETAPCATDGLTCLPITALSGGGCVLPSGACVTPDAGCTTDADCEAMFGAIVCHQAACNTSTGACFAQPQTPNTACDDGVTCTSDGQCDSNGVCVNTTLDHGSCTDPAYCNGEEQCDPTSNPSTWLTPGSGCVAGIEPITLQSPSNPCAMLDCNDATNMIDEIGCSQCGEVYADPDGDGFYATGLISQSICTDPVPPLYTTLGKDNDCGPNDAWRHPDSFEICGDSVDDNCDGSDATCPSSTNASVAGLYLGTCEQAKSDPRVLAVAQYPATDNAYFAGSGCHVFFEFPDVPGEFYMRNIGLTLKPGASCPTAGFNSRLYAHTVAGDITQCPPVTLYEDGQMDPTSNHCRKYLKQMMTQGETYLFNNQTGGETQLRRRLNLFPTTEVSCAPVGGGYASAFGFTSIMSASIIINDAFQAAQ